MGGMPYYVPESIPGIAALVHREKVREIVGSSGQITQLATYLERNTMRLNGVDTITTGGSALPSLVAEQILRVTNAPYVENQFAATEVGSISILRKPTDNRNFVGTLVKDVGVQIVDPETHTPLPDGEVGVVRVTSPDIIDGYFHNPEATASNFRDGWFYTGDLGHLVGDEFYLDGRIAEIINAGGVKTNPTWVDDHVSKIPGVLECATFARYGSTGLPVVACAVILGSESTDDELTAAVTKELGAHAPREWYRVESIPRTDMGKPLRRALTEQYSESLPR
jgi:acyl-CoA synthetase (AMP-forming)/AMP-acid ligase II